MKSFPTSKSTAKNKVFIKTFGCQMNEADAARMLALLEQDNFKPVENAEEADLIIINTCSVREKAHQKAMSAIGQYSKGGRDIKIGVTGCVASQEKGRISERFPSVDFVLGTDHTDKIKEAAHYKRIKDGAFIAADFKEMVDYRFPEIALATSKRMVKAFVTIMKGCDNKCAFCIVPMTRGFEISRRPEDIIREIQLLEENGVREVTLLGQNVNSYGKHLADRVDFPGLLRKIDEETSIWRLRFTSPHPKDLSMRLIEEYQRNRILCHHIHLPVQSGSTKILQRMRRAYTRETYLKCVEALRQACPDMAITTDLIVGFPGETHDDFKETQSLMREVSYDASYSFAYSERPGTEAARFVDDVSPETKAERLQEVQAQQAKISNEKNRKFMNKIVPVLVEGEDKAKKNKMMGRTPCNRVINFNGHMDDISVIVNIRVTRATAYALYGEKEGKAKKALKGV